MSTARPAVTPAPNARILVTRADRIGDLVISTPVFQSLREKFPSAYIACLTFPENREIVEGNPNLNEVILYDKKGSQKNILGNILFARRLASKKFDIVIHLHATNRMHWISRLARIPIRIGYKRKLGWALTHAVLDAKREGKMHEAEYNFDLLKLIGVEKPKKMKTFFPLTERAAASLDELLKHLQIPQDKPWIIVSPSASCPSKRWPADRFGELIRRLTENNKAIAIIVGTRGDRPLIEKLKAVSGPVYDLSGKLTLGMLGVLLSRAAFLVSNDSGPVHISDAVGTPVISIFGRNQPGLSPKRWGPLGENSRVIWKDIGCNPCLAHNCQINFLCLDVISVNDVLKAIEPGTFGNVPPEMFRRKCSGIS